MKILVCAVLAIVAQSAGAAHSEEEARKMAIRITSPAFKEGEPIPARHACEGLDLSPALEWTGIPDGTRSLALICDDPDAPMGTWVHWVLFNLPADAKGLSENVAKKPALDNGAKQDRRPIVPTNRVEKAPRSVLKSVR